VHKIRKGDWFGFGLKATDLFRKDIKIRELDDKPGSVHSLYQERNCH